VGTNFRKARKLSITSIDNLTDMALEKGTEVVKLFYEGLNPEYVIQALKTIINKRLTPRVGSQRLETTSNELIEILSISGQRKITFAPETNERLRPLLGKALIDDSELLCKIEIALKYGFKDIGLYFIIGLPGETLDDILDIAKLIDKSFEILKRLSPYGNLIVGINPLYPKPKTSLQWLNYIGQGESIKKYEFLLENLRNRTHIASHRAYVDEIVTSSKGNYNFYNENASIIFETSIYSSLSYYQPILSRGSRQVGRLLQHVARNVDDVSAWKKVLSDHGMNESDIFNYDGLALPQDVVRSNVSHRYLSDEYCNALSLKEVEKCVLDCSKCSIKCLMD